MPVRKRALIECFVALALVIAAPVLVSMQPGEAREPWDELWPAQWPALMDYEKPSLDPRTAGLHERAAASLRRVSRPGDMRLAADF